MVEMTAGDTFPFEIRLNKAGIRPDVSGASEILVAVRDASNAKVAGDWTASLINGDLANGLVEFQPSGTSALDGEYVIEAQVTGGSNPGTYQDKLLMLPGVIT